MVASVNTDALQAAVMVVAAVAAFLWVMTAVGGPAGIAASMSARGPEAGGFLEPLGVLDPPRGSVSCCSSRSAPSGNPICSTSS